MYLLVHVYENFSRLERVSVTEVTDLWGWQLRLMELGFTPFLILPVLGKKGCFTSPDVPRLALCLDRTHSCFLFFNNFVACILFIYFYWGLVALLCCISFCSTMKWISCVYSFIPVFFFFFFSINFITVFLNLPLTRPSNPIHLGHQRAPSWAPCATWQVDF